ncbi:cytochrome c oxidase subunit 7A2, mitochondrial [Crotalus tigris]|uniref:cytochrome c oxidase subunit 7A2, mitochondrial n=1 Tax=Crotalus tigris TaxID=88082 RepID=UPI00192FB3DC|nr:cytochrome c oxidase subunit 7A2, mitochondrial [Crotalus tigris]
MRSLLVSRLQSLRCFTTSARQMENKVPEFQKIFQADNDLPVHLKRGISDMLMYRATMLLAAGATSYAVYCIYDLGKIKKH